MSVGSLWSMYKAGVRPQRQQQRQPQPSNSSRDVHNWVADRVDDNTGWSDKPSASNACATEPEPVAKKWANYKAVKQLDRPATTATTSAAAKGNWQPLKPNSSSQAADVHDEEQLMHLLDSLCQRSGWPPAQLQCAEAGSFPTFTYRWTVGFQVDQMPNCSCAVQVTINGVHYKPPRPKTVKHAAKLDALRFACTSLGLAKLTTNKGARSDVVRNGNGSQQTLYFCGDKPRVVSGQPKPPRGMQPTVAPDTSAHMQANNPGLRLMKAMGWQPGTGLGVKQQGMREPIQVTLNQPNKIGVGGGDVPARGKKKKNRKKKNRDVAALNDQWYAEPGFDGAEIPRYIPDDAVTDETQPDGHWQEEWASPPEDFWAADDAASTSRQQHPVARKPASPPAAAAAREVQPQSRPQHPIPIHRAVNGLGSLLSSMRGQPNADVETDDRNREGLCSAFLHAQDDLFEAGPSHWSNSPSDSWPVSGNAAASCSREEMDRRFAEKSYWLFRNYDDYNYAADDFSDMRETEAGVYGDCPLNMAAGGVRQNGRKQWNRTPEVIDLSCEDEPSCSSGEDQAVIVLDVDDSPFDATLPFDDCPLQSTSRERAPENSASVFILTDSPICQSVSPQQQPMSHLVARPVLDGSSTKVDRSAQQSQQLRLDAVAQQQASGDSVSALYAYCQRLALPPPRFTIRSCVDRALNAHLKVEVVVDGVVYHHECRLQAHKKAKAEAAHAVIMALAIE